MSRESDVPVCECVGIDASECGSRVKGPVVLQCSVLQSIFAALQHCICNLLTAPCSSSFLQRKKTEVEEKYTHIWSCEHCGLCMTTQN